MQKLEFLWVCRGNKNGFFSSVANSPIKFFIQGFVLFLGLLFPKLRRSRLGMCFLDRDELFVYNNEGCEKMAKGGMYGDSRC